MNLKTKTPLALYFHWPFCKHKCPYCDFNSHVREKVEEERWLQAFKEEIFSWKETLENKVITSIFFGGGTPSLMPPKLVSAIITQLEAITELAPDIEITLEANPTSVEASKLQAFAQAGINRLSLGIQSFNNEELQYLGRQHSASEAIGAIRLAASLFPKYSFDLIYALPGQTQETWKKALDKALELSSNHLSLYQLTIEKGTEFYRRARQGTLPLMSQEDANILYDFTNSYLDYNGFGQYEVSNYARPGHECKHNLAYWRYNEYLGIGPGAHSRIMVGGRVVALMAIHRPETWLDQALASADANGINRKTLQQVDFLTPKELMQEILLMGWRLPQGVRRSRIVELLGPDYEAILNPQQYQLLKDNGVIIEEGGDLKLHSDYWLVSNEVITRLI